MSAPQPHDEPPLPSQPDLNWLAARPRPDLTDDQLPTWWKPAMDETGIRRDYLVGMGRAAAERQAGLDTWRTRKRSKDSPGVVLQRLKQNLKGRRARAEKIRQRLLEIELALHKHRTGQRLTSPEYRAAMFDYLDIPKLRADLAEVEVLIAQCVDRIDQHQAQHPGRQQPRP
jgi:hypothetical protein